MTLFKINNDDIFISYCRSDAKTYTDGVANELTKKGFSCFTDALGSDSGKEIPESLIRKLKSCMMLVVIGSKDASCSEAVAKEIEVFSLTKGTSSIIPIDFNNAIITAKWQHFIIGLRREEELQEALATGNPSPSIVNRIEKAFAYRKSKDRLRVYTRSAAIILGVLIIGILGAAFIANKQFQKAAGASKLANEATVLAQAQTEIAKKQTGKAEEATRLAKISEANAAEALKNKNIADAQFKLASEKALAATAMAQTQQKIATSLQYANESQELLQNPKLVTASVNMAIKSTELNRSINTYSAASDAALRSSLTFLADFKHREVYPEKKLFFNTGGDIIEKKSTDSITQFYRMGESIPFFQYDKDFMCDPCTSISVSKNGNYIAFGYEKLVRVFNTVDKTHKDLVYGKNSEHTVSRIALSPNGKYLVVATNYDSHDDRTIVWEIAKDSTYNLQTSSTSTVNGISFSANGTSLVLECMDINSEGNFVEVVYVWNVDFNSDDFFDSYEFANPVKVKHENISGGVTAGPDNTCFATWYDSISIVWKIGSDNSYKPVSYILTKEAVSNLAFKPNSEELLIIESENPYDEVGNSVETWNYEGYEEKNQYFLDFQIKKVVYQGQSRNLTGLKQFPNEQENGFIFWQDKKDSGMVQKPISFQSEAIQFSSEDLKTIITFKDNLNIWNYSVLENMIPIDTSFLSRDNFTITPDRRWVSWIQKDKDGQSKGVILKLTGNKYEQISSFPIDRAISAMKFLPDGTALFLLDENQSLVIWDVQNKRIQTTLFFEEPGPVQSFKLSPEGRYISTVNITRNKKTGEDEFILNIWDCKTFRKLASVKKLTDTDLYGWSPDEKYTWSSDEKYILVSCIGNYKLLQVENNKITTIENPRSTYGPSVNVFSFSPSGKYFGVAVEKGKVRIFKTTSCEEVGRLTPMGEVRSIAFRNDDHYLTTVSENKSFFSINEEKMTVLTFWQFLPDDLIAEARRRLNKIREK